MAPSPTRPRMPSVPKYLRVMVVPSGGRDVVRRLRLLHQQREQVGDAVAQFTAVADLVDRAVLDQEFRTLEAFRQRLAHGLLDHARAGEADQRLRLSDVDVTE